MDSSEDTIVICEVEFSPGGKRYSYLVEQDAFSVGDYVVVHAGKDNHETTVRIVTIRPRSSEDKMSLSEALKQVLRHANEKEIQAFSKPQKKKTKPKTKKTSKKDNYCGTENSSLMKLMVCKPMVRLSFRITMQAVISMVETLR